ncbi:hypothetical protein [Kribbella sp. NPDC050459]|uniref:hypothetical protein n=1 Tax=Kribbella sp. NPDC050459 TaxID=3155785 RepID=UPI0033C88A01
MSSTTRVCRWVADTGDDLLYTSEGLLDSNTMMSAWYTGDRPRSVDELVNTPESFVLLAPGGAGKTTVIEELRSRESSAVWLDLKMTGPEGLQGLFERRVANADIVYVDAIDEAVLADPRVSYQLSRLLSGAQRRIRWRLVCRPAAWDADLAAQLKASLDSFRELKLLPLDEDAVRTVASARDADADAFLRKVRDAGLGALLGSPLQLLDLLRHWDEHGDVPAKLADSMAYSVARLMKEEGAFRVPPTQLPDQMLVVARRVAAFAMFCGNGRFQLGAKNHAGGLATRNLPSDAEPASTANFSLRAYEEVLGSALFTSVPGDVLAFVHQAYAEFLAADYLVQRRVGGARLKSLLGCDPDGVVPGPMLPILGWLLTQSHDVDSELVERNAKGLLQTATVEVADNALKAHLVRGLLRGAATGWVVEPWGLDMSGLAHSGLGDELRAAAATPANQWQALWVCRIARECVVRDVTPELRGIAFDTSWSTTVRAEAVAALAVTADHTILAGLAPLLNLSTEDDPDDEVLGATLRAVLPDKVPAEQIAASIRPTRSRHYIGGYAQIIEGVPDLVRVQDLLHLVAAAAKVDVDFRDSTLNRYDRSLIGAAWRHCDLPGMTAALARLLVHVRQTYLFRGRAELPWLGAAPDRRRELGLEILRVDRKHGFLTVTQFELLSGDDVEWLLDALPALGEDVREGAARAVGLLASYPSDARTADRILTLPREHPAFEATEGLRGICPLDSDIARTSREMSQSGGGENAAKIVQLHEAITALDGESTEWWRAAAALTDDSSQELFDFDLTERSYWQALTPDERQEMVTRGIEFLREWTPRVDDWARLEEKPYALVIPDWSGVHLILTLAVRWPVLLRTLSADDWQKWAPAIVRTMLVGDSREPYLKTRELASEAGQAAIDRAMIDLARDTSSTTFGLHPLANMENPEFVHVVAAIVLDVDESLRRREHAMQVLHDSHPDKSLELAHQVRNAPDKPWLASRVLAAREPDSLVRAWLATGRITEPQVLNELQVTMVTADLLGPFASLLFGGIQLPEDDSDSPFSPVSSVLHRVLQTLAEAGMTSALESLLPGRSPEQADYIRHFMQDSRTRAAELAHTPITPTELMRLVSDADARIVRDDAGLAVVLIEELDRIQRYLTHQDGFKEIWNGYPGEAGATPETEDTISDWLVRRFNERLKPHLIVDRELQATHHKKSGTGTRMDISATRTGFDAAARVIFEAKRVEHPDLLTALQDQLIGQYLKPLGLNRGIYLVYWVDKAKRPSGWRSTNSDRAALRTVLKEQAAESGSSVTVDVYILDISGPE